MADWINELIEGDTLDGSFEQDGTLKRPVDLTELDSRVTQLATRLEVTCQETSSQLEQTIEDISRNVPRLNFDLQIMRESALALQRELGSIHRTTMGTSASHSTEEEGTTKALEQIQYLDAVKRGMEAARAVLQEAENWSTLESEITSLLKEASYAKAASRLSEAAKSMSVFAHTPEYEARRTLMINLQNQTEAALSAALVAAINMQDIAACKNFHDIFHKIEREGEFKNYYFGARRLAIVEMWSKASLSDVQGDGGLGDMSPHALMFSELLARFLAELLTLINEERSSIPTIFSTTSDPVTILSLFIQSTVEALTPSFSQRLSGMVAWYGTSALVELLKSFKLVEEFAIKVEKVMEKAAIARSGGLGPTSPPKEDAKGHSRNKSKRLSMSRRIPSNQKQMLSLGLSPEAIDTTWQHALFEPFIDLQTEHATLEKRLLDDALSKLDSSYRKQLVNVDDAEVKARVLREKAVDVFGLAEESFARCLSFTHGYGAVGGLEAIDHLFEQFFATAKADFLRSPADLTANSDSSSIDRFDEELLTTSELAAFQLALNLLNTQRALKEQLKHLDSRTKSELVSVSHALRMSQSFPNGHSLPNAAKGEAELLAQSAMNSMELNTLLDTIDPPPTVPVFTSASSGTSGSVPPTPMTASIGGQLSSSMRSEPTAPIRTSPVLRGSFNALSDFTKATQAFLQQLILRPFFTALSTYASQPSWSLTEQQQAAAQANSYGFNVPTFSLSATPTMRKVRDGLMALPRMLVDYAGDDDALAFEIDMLPFSERNEALKEYREWVAAQIINIPHPDRNATGSPRMNRLSLSSPSARRLSFSSATAALQLPPASTSTRPPQLASETIQSAWLSSITFSLLSHLTTSVLPSIRMLTTLGAAQLAYDLGDLANVASMLNAYWEDLDRWRECCELSNDEGKRRWLTVQGASAFAQGVSNAQAQSIVDADAIFRLVARLRGWST